MISCPESEYAMLICEVRCMPQGPLNGTSAMVFKKILILTMGKKEVGGARERVG